MGRWHQRADKRLGIPHHGNQETLVVKNKLKTPGELVEDDNPRQKSQLTMYFLFRICFCIFTHIFCGSEVGVFCSLYTE